MVERCVSEAPSQSQVAFEGGGALSFARAQNAQPDSSLDTFGLVAFQSLQLYSIPIRKAMLLLREPNLTGVDVS